MYDYNIAQWFLFFVIYCFAGWCWESAYVSVCDKKWTNRGFLTGPYLPIYGSGAVIILLATLPFQKNPVLVFLLGMAAASLLEYVTGAVMEAVFKVRYWDYSDEFLNINGYICPLASFLWGVFSVLLVRFVHRPVEGFVMELDGNVAWAAAIFFAVVMGTDTVCAVKTAIDLREMLRKITENNEEIRRIQKRIDVLVAVAEDDRAEFMRLLESKIAEGKAMIKKSGVFIRLMVRSNPTATSKRFKEALEQFREHLERK